MALEPEESSERSEQTNKENLTMNKRAMDGGTHWLDDHLETLRRKIISEASALATSDGREDVEPRDVAQAAMLFAPGKQFTDNNEYDLSFSRRVGLSISGVTLISAILAIAFGAIGMYQARVPNADMASGAFDIAKIFAGAIVGSTGATVASTFRRS